MKILFLNHNVVWSGGFFRAYHWGRQLARRGHSVTLLSISKASHWRFHIQERDGIRLVETPDLLQGSFRSGWDIWDTIRRILYVSKDNFDLVHSVDSRPVCIFPALILKKWKQTKLVVDWGDWWGHGGTITERSNNIANKIFSPVETFFEEGFRNFADGSLVLTSALEKRAISLGVAPSSILRIPHGADIEGIRPLNQKESRRLLGIDSNLPILGYLGAMFQSDMKFLIDAFKIMRTKNNKIRLYLIGNTQLCFPNHLFDSDSVVSTGRLSYEHLQEYISSCDIMLLPLCNSIANRGRWPSKVNDYLAAGKPVVSTRVGDIANLIEEGQCGILTDVSPEVFATKTLEILQKPDLLTEMGENSRKLAEAKLDWRILTDQLEKFYIEIVQNDGFRSGTTINGKNRFS